MDNELTAYYIVVHGNIVVGRHYDYDIAEMHALSIKGYFQWVKDYEEELEELEELESSDNTETAP